MAENKYFIPSIEDLHVGYECERNIGIRPGLGEGWKHFVFESPEDIIDTYSFGHTPIRVPYLTKEQIEKEGWKEETGYYKTHEYSNSYATYFCAFMDNHKIRISEYTKTDSTDLWRMQRRSIVFEGECKDINTFRYICKLLNI